MKSLEEVIKFIKNQKKELEQKFGIKKIGIFGSYARGEQTEKSDLDILIEFKEKFETFRNYMQLKFYLEDNLKIKVDLVVASTLKEKLKPYIMKEVLYV
jgi:predicted nucleotidyltransferase